jgi:hypothetical protein
MHTALCAFHDHATAERARDLLLRSGFTRQDVHLQHSDAARHASDDDETRQEMLRHRGGVEHEIALDQGLVERVTGFFGHLFGPGHPQRETWDGHVDSGRTVVVVDAHDEDEAQRARRLMEQLQAADSNVLYRPTQRPVRDILADTPMAADTPLSTQPMAQTHGNGWNDRRAPASNDRSIGSTEERAVASGEQRAMPTSEPRSVATGEQRSLDLGRDDTDKVGLRYADKGDADKPVVNRDGLGRTRSDD